MSTFTTDIITVKTFGNPSRKSDEREKEKKKEKKLE